MTGPFGYHELANLLREEITSGRRKPGARMPSETDLVQAFGISRTTARRAIRELRAEGLIEVRHGHPTRVRIEPERTPVRLQRGSTLVVRPASAAERAIHDLPPGGQVAVIQYGARVAVYPVDRHVFTTA